MGTISGGSLTKRVSPSTTSVSFSRACMLSRVLALASSLSARALTLDRVLSAPLRPSRPSSPPICRSTASMSTREYHTSRSRSLANLAISVRYAAAVPSTTLARSLSENPRLRPAMARLAVRRLTSHSHGPGRVSSKSFRSKTRVRSADAKTPKLLRCASPQACTVRPESAVVDRSDAMIRAAPR